MGVLLGLVVLLACTGVGVWVIRSEVDPSISKKMTQVFLTGSILSGFLLIGLCSYTVIPAGSGGVAVSFGNVLDKPLQSGVNFIAPWWQIERLPTRIQLHVGNYDCASSDTQPVKIEMKLNFQLKLESLPSLYREIGTSVEQIAARVIDPAAHETLKAKVSMLKLVQIVERREEIELVVEQDLETWFNRYDVKLSEVAITDIAFSHIQEKAIEDKQIEEQRALQKGHELTRARVMALAEKERSRGLGGKESEDIRGEAESQRIIAEAEQKAQVYVADAEREAYELLQKAVSPLLLQREQVKQWDGTLPQYYLGGELFPFSK